MTSYAPIEIIFGNTIRDPLQFGDIDLENPKRSHKEYIEYISNRRKLISIRSNLAQQKYDEQRKENYDKKYKVPNFKVGDKVLYNIAPQQVGNEHKLTEDWIGPFTIKEIFNDGINYKIVNDKLETYIVNIKLIKYYHEPNELLLLTPYQKIEFYSIQMIDEMNDKLHQIDMAPLENINTYFKKDEIQNQSDMLLKLLIKYNV